MRLVEAFEYLGSEWKLVLAGTLWLRFGSHARTYRAQSSQAGYSGARLCYRSELEDLYRRASILAFPSLDEGFGMPVVDAMARGVAVLTSNVSAMPEVVGHAALLVDPSDVRSIADGLCRLATNSELREILIRAGLTRAKDFSWEKSVAATWQVYQELIGNANG